MAIRQDLTVIRGEAATFTFNPAVAADITGWTLTFLVTEEDGATVLSQTPTVAVAASGIFTVTISAAATAALHPGVFPYVIRRTDSGSQAVLALGDVLVEEDIPPP